jgi:hypothetical protein
MTRLAKQEIAIRVPNILPPKPALLIHQPAPARSQIRADPTRTPTPIATESLIDNTSNGNSLAIDAPMQKCPHETCGSRDHKHLLRMREGIRLSAALGCAEK